MTEDPHSMIVEGPKISSEANNETMVVDDKTQGIRDTVGGVSDGARDSGRKMIHQPIVSEDQDISRSLSRYRTSSCWRSLKYPQ